MHLGTALRRLDTWHGHRVAIVDQAGDWTFSSLLARMARFGQALYGLGLIRGDRVALLLPDIREYIECDYGALAAGLVRVPMDPRGTRADTVSLLSHVGARALIVHANLAAIVEGLRQDVETLEHIVVVGGKIADAENYEDLLQRAADRFVPAGHEDDLATLNFSGGTTGNPKAIMLRHRNLFAVTQNTIAGFGIFPDLTFVNVRPLWPVAQVIVFSYFMAGARIVLGGRFDPEGFAPLIQRSGAARTSLVPTQLVRWLDHLQHCDPRLTRFDAVHVGGSRIAPPTFQRALETIGPRIGVLYGLTEAPITCYLQPQRLNGSDGSHLTESVGRSLYSYEVRLEGGDDDLGRSGEVLIRGENVMAGYWNNPEATDATIIEGWLHTGDIGRFDDQGNLYIIGRLKEVIRSGSTSIVPKEVEDAVALHPAVRDVAVVGMPDIEWGERVTAVVVLKPGAQATEADIIAHCRPLLAAYKKPKAVFFRDRLPRSHYGKVPRSELLASIMGESNNTGSGDDDNRR